MRSMSPPTEVRRECLAGALGAVLFGLALLLGDAAGLGTLLAASPEYSAAFMLGAFVAFAPLVLCVAIGGLRRGEQHSVSSQRDDLD